MRVNVRLFIRSHAMPCAAVAAALATCLVVPPDAGYAGYIDWGTLGKLACMLLAVRGLGESGVVQGLARRTAVACPGVRPLTFALVGATALASMLVTNDMALLALLPLAGACLLAAGRPGLVAPVFVLQGLAANLCGMLLPFGNPQNIYLAGAFDIGFGEFVAAMAPPFLVSSSLIAACCLMTGRGRTEVRVGRQPVRPRLAAASAVALAACVAAVLRAIPVWACMAVVVACVLAGDRRLLLRTDWSLVVTFAAFFVFSGNLVRVPAVQQALASWLAGGAFLPAALLSQAVSNVPAAIVLSRFTADWPGLLVGVNAGGAGTPVASLATLIVIAQYASMARELRAGPKGGAAARTAAGAESGHSGPGGRAGCTETGAWVGSSDAGRGAWTRPMLPTGRFVLLLEGLNLGFLAVLLMAGVLLGW